MSTKCHTCSAKFGNKFDCLTCSFCGHLYCDGHLIEEEMFVLNNDSREYSGQGICFDCLFKQWAVDERPKGIVDRWIKRPMQSAWSYLSNKPNATELVKVSDTSLSKINNKRAFAVFKHQHEIVFEDVIRDAKEYAKLVAVSRGRKNEKDLSFNDLYKFIEWIKNHPVLPEWAHAISWHQIESTPIGLAYVMDAWHIFSAAVATTPVGAIYHAGDRVLEQKTGKGFFSHVYQNAKDKSGLNFNLKMAVLSYIVGCFILQIYETENTTA